MENARVEKSKAFHIADMLGYAPHAVLNRDLVLKTTGKITVVSLDAGTVVSEKISPFDVFVQIIHGQAEISIDGSSQWLDSGQSIILPAHASITMKAHVPFKMISTIIKSGYEDVA